MAQATSGSLGNIRCIFVVDFHPKQGNTVIYSSPEGAVDLDGVEFKAMPSGSHLAPSDFIFFRTLDFSCGFACFKSKKDEDAVRGTRSKAVGIIGSDYPSLAPYRGALDDICNICLEANDDIPTETIESILKAAQESLNEEDVKTLSVRRPAWNPDSDDTGLTVETIFNQTLTDPLKVVDLSDSLSILVEQLGRRIMSLWRMMLLQRRVLFLCKAPVEPGCIQAMGISMLASTTLDPSCPTPASKYFGYLNLNDLTTLHQVKESYVACVSETIFEHKTEVYDVFVRDHKLLGASKLDSTLLKTTDSDTRRFRALRDAVSNPEFSKSETGQFLSEDEIYCKFFTELNNRIFTALWAARRRPAQAITRQDVQALGLDVNLDKLFLRELVEIYCPELSLAELDGCLKCV